MNKLYLGLLFIGCINTALTFGQDKQYGNGFNCSQHTVTNQLFDENPAIREEYNKNEAALRKKAKALYENRHNKDEKIYRIPVVFHVIHKGGAENITEEQVKSAIQVLNEDYSKTNSAAANVVAAFKDRVADCKIEFRLATIDPNGNCTNGIDRFYDERTAGAGDNVKAGRQWPRDKYLNIYTCLTIGSGAAGYAYYPGTIGADRDGILICHDYVGRVGTSQAYRSSALSHEVAHYLALAHTWGSTNDPELPSNCGSDDGVDDTPNCIGSSSCILNRNTCDTEQPNDEIDNIQNFMEYAYCSAMFTEGQKARMRATLESTTASRNNLSTDANLLATGANYEGSPVNLCKADFMMSVAKPVCEGTTITYTDMSYNNVSSWNWSFPGGTPSSSTEKNPVVTYSSPGTYSVSLTVGNGAQSVSVNKENVVTVLAFGASTLPFAETFENINTNLSPVFSVENPNNDLTWTLNSSAGYQSTNCAFIKNRVISGSGKLDKLYSNTFDLSSMVRPRIKFRYAYAKKQDGNSDQLTIYASKDCGVTWTQRKVMKGSGLVTNPNVSSIEFVPTQDNQWKEADVNVESYNVPGVRFMFEWQNDGGNNMYLDNINVYDANGSGINDLNNVAANIEVYPNPVEGVGTIAFTTLKPGHTNVQLKDLLGKHVKMVFDGDLNSGDYSYEFQTHDIPAGLYLMSVSINGIIATKKFIIH